MGLRRLPLGALVKIARVNQGSFPFLTSPGGIGDASALPSVEDLTDVDVTGISDGDVLVWDAGTSTWVAGPVPPPTATSLWVPVMTEIDPDVWAVVTTGDGDAVMTEVPL